MKIKIVEKRSIFVGLFTVFYFVLVFPLLSPAIGVIEKYVFNYEKPILPPNSLIDPIIPNKAEIYSFAIYLFAAIIIYFVVLRSVKINNE